VPKGEVGSCRFLIRSYSTCEPLQALIVGIVIIQMVATFLRDRIPGLSLVLGPDKHSEHQQREARLRSFVSGQGNNVFAKRAWADFTASIQQQAVEKDNATNAPSASATNHTPTKRIADTQEYRPTSPSYDTSASPSAESIIRSSSKNTPNKRVRRQPDVSEDEERLVPGHHQCVPPVGNRLDRPDVPLIHT